MLKLRPASCRAARAMLEMSTAQLAEEAAVPVESIVAFESEDSPWNTLEPRPPISVEMIERLQAAIEKCGVTISNEQGRPGATLEWGSVKAETNVDLPKYVTLRPRRNGTYRVLFELPKRFRPPGWRPAIPLPLTEPRTGDLSDATELARVISDGADCYRSYLRERRGGAILGAGDAGPTGTKRSDTGIRGKPRRRKPPAA